MPGRFARRKVDDEEIWLDIQAGRFYGVNEAGAAILQAWREGHREPAAIVERLTAVFDVAPAEALAQVTSFLAKARPLGLLEEGG